MYEIKCKGKAEAETEKQQTHAETDREEETVVLVAGSNEQSNESTDRIWIMALLRHREIL